MTRRGTLLVLGGAGALAAAATLSLAPAASARAPDAFAAFETVRSVLQHPRCQNCHIPGDAPLQFDEGRTHAQWVKRGPDGRGSIGLSCSTCHGTSNPPPSYGPHMPPGAPEWHLPPPDARMVFIGLSSAELARRLKDPKETRGRDLEAMYEHVAHDQLVGWGWHPGVGREPVPIPRPVFAAAFRAWIDGGAPIPPEASPAGR